MDWNEQKVPAAFPSFGELFPAFLVTEPLLAWLSRSRLLPTRNSHPFLSGASNASTASKDATPAKGGRRGPGRTLSCPGSQSWCKDPGERRPPGPGSSFHWPSPHFLKPAQAHPQDVRPDTEAPSLALSPSSLPEPWRCSAQCGS